MSGFRTITVDGEVYIAFPADDIFQLAGEIRERFKDALTLDSGLNSSRAGADPESSTISGEGAARQAAAPHDPAGGDAAGGPQRSGRDNPATMRHDTALPVSLGRGGAGSTPGRQPVSSSESARANGWARRGGGPAAHTEEAERKRKANTGVSDMVLTALVEIGQGDVRAIVDAVEKKGLTVSGDDPARTVSSALWYLRTRGKVEKVEGEWGVWRRVA